MARLFVSAAHKSSGKTTLSIGLAAALRRRGIETQVFKKGPDYIDPLWLTRASGRATYNLDFNTQTPEEILGLYARHRSLSGIDLIEGNKGLHDGVDRRGSDSSAALARLLDAPVVLVIDASGMTRGIAPLLLGYKLFDPEVEVAGVVLNQVATPRQEEKLRAAVEDYTGLPVFGALGRSPAVIVKERHLGLTTPGDVDGPDARIERIREIVEQGVDIDALIAVAGNARPVRVAAEHVHARIADVRIGVAMDEAFCFYYRDDLETLERAGAEIVPFSPLADPHLPDVDGLFIGGGFPETHVGALAANTSLKAEIAAAAAAGMPIHAECGGLMYLSRSIRYEGEAGEMVGVVAGDSVMQSKPQGRGLVVLAENRDGAAPTVPAHEFHFARLEGLPADASFAWRVRRGQGIDGEHDGIVINNVVASFSHFRDTSRCHWARDFVETVRREKRTRKTGTAGVTKSGR